MKGKSLMIPEIINAKLAGLLPGEKAKTSTPMRKKTGSLPPVQERPFTVKRFSKRSVILMKSILHIWKILMLGTVPEFLAMRTGMRRRRWCIMWEAAQAAPDTISSRQDILPETIFTLSTKICLLCRSF